MQIDWSKHTFGNCRCQSHDYGNCHGHPWTCGCRARLTMDELIAEERALADRLLQMRREAFASSVRE